MVLILIILEVLYEVVNLQFKDGQPTVLILIILEVLYEVFSLVRFSKDRVRS